MKAATIVVCVLLSGCASRPVWLENRAVCTVGGVEAHVISKWGPFSIGSPLAAADAEVMCKKTQSE
jgi:hypothetical protein